MENGSEKKQMEIVYHKQAVKTLERTDAATRQRICAGINGIPNGDIKPLKGHSDERMRLRIGKYRVVFRYMQENAETVLFVMEIGSRGDIYK